VIGIGGGTKLAPSFEICFLGGINSLLLENPKWQVYNITKRVSQKLGNWKVKFLSQAGNEVLLEAVVQVIPTYSMGVFQLSVSLCNELNKMMQNFYGTIGLKMEI
jgi:hypothetical protein